MSDASSGSARKTVLNVGSGPRGHVIHPSFTGDTWQEVRLDLDPAAAPDVVGSVVDMRAIFEDGVFDAIWSSHNIEHLFDHEVTQALGEFHRVLKPDGYVVVTCPDLQTVAELLLDRGLDGKAYDAPVGPITVHDILFGHGASITKGNTFMAHRTGFTQERLGRKAIEAGFRDVRVGRGTEVDLWAILPMPDCRLGDLRQAFHGSTLAFLLDTDDEASLDP